MSTPVGADIESVCGKCGDVWHVVVAKVGDSIAKVQCKQCGGYHRYRSGGAGGGQRRAAGTTSRRAGPRRKASSAAEPATQSGPSVEPDLERPVRTYRIADSYEPRERIDHPTFGRGVVEVVDDPGKMRVFFPGGRRVLAQSKRSHPRLEPPPRGRTVEEDR